METCSCKDSTFGNEVSQSWHINFSNWMGSSWWDKFSIWSWNKSIFITNLCKKLAKKVKIFLISLGLGLLSAHGSTNLFLALSKLNVSKSAETWNCIENVSGHNKMSQNRKILICWNKFSTYCIIKKAAIYSKSTSDSTKTYRVMI